MNRAARDECVVQEIMGRNILGKAESKCTLTFPEHIFSTVELIISSRPAQLSYLILHLFCPFMPLLARLACHGLDEYLVGDACYERRGLKEELFTA